ncbi:MAG: 6-carboxytetrahydropterin synthase QueD [Lewinellaceae bacterium]|nr:6-carboxytetrahydropterin synthase QueD [Lewinellaceae bacterium]
MELFKEFTFDSAHSLPFVPETHKCRRVHGHTYRIRVVVEGPLDPVLGWVKDFADVKKLTGPIKEQLDHHYLNDIEGLENPTAENLAIWIYNKMKPELPELKEIWIWETPESGCIYRG